MAEIGRPQYNLFGNTFVKPIGLFIDEGIPKGEIDTSSLGKTTIEDGVEFSKFELEVKGFILNRLGHPVVRVELTPAQIKTCIDEAVNKLSYHAPSWSTQYVAFTPTVNVNVYELPQYIMDGLINVTYRKNTFGLPLPPGSFESDMFINYFQSNFLFSDFSMGDYYLLQIHLEMMRKVLGIDGTWDIINNKYLRLSPTPSMSNDVVIVEYRAIDSNTIHPAYKNFIQRYALAIAKGILGQIRSKYAVLPGPSGGAKLNGEALIMQSEKELEKLDIQLSSEFEDPPALSTY